VVIVWVRASARALHGSDELPLACRPMLGQGTSGVLATVMAARQGHFNAGTTHGAQSCHVTGALVAASPAMT